MLGLRVFVRGARFRCVTSGIRGSEGRVQFKVKLQEMLALASRQAAGIADASVLCSGAWRRVADSTDAGATHNLTGMLLPNWTKRDDALLAILCGYLQLLNPSENIYLTSANYQPSPFRFAYLQPTKKYHRLLPLEPWNESLYADFFYKTRQSELKCLKIKKIRGLCLETSDLIVGLLIWKMNFPGVPSPTFGKVEKLKGVRHKP